MTVSMAIHSYRGGTGKSTTAANLAAVLAAMGLKVATVDLDLTSPGLHMIYGVTANLLKHTLNDYLYGKCKLGNAVLDITRYLGLSRGRLYFLGSSMKPEEIAKLLREGYDENLFRKITEELEKLYSVDLVIFDTHPGLTEDTLLSVISSDLSLLVTRMDKQDITGTYITAQVLRRFKKVSYAVLNMVPPKFASIPELASEVSRLVGAPVIAVIPFYEDVLEHRSHGVFVLKHPRHPFTTQMVKLAERIVSILRG
ncbi:MAG: MinD/ParA family protein [Thermoprotei archaeon]|nr:MAG: MinD/ParA family protein [Thermoprotei archaeon]